MPYQLLTNRKQLKPSEKVTGMAVVWQFSELPKKRVISVSSWYQIGVFKGYFQIRPNSNLGPGTIQIGTFEY